MSPISSLGAAANLAQQPITQLAFTPVPIPKVSPIGAGSLADAVQHLPPMSGGSLGDLVGRLLRGGVLLPSFPQGR
jgi:hypothetical protein